MDSFHDADAVNRLRRRCRIDPHQLRRVRNAFYKKHQSAAEALSHLTANQQAELAGGLSFHALELQGRHDSQRDGASKLIFRTGRGHLLESVILRIASGRTSLCVSSQVGCAAHCEFCATGHMGMAVDLSRDEILDQVIQANLLLRPERRSVRNVVFMGMGEPLHNEDAVYAALEVLLAPHGLALTSSRVMVSTVGIPEALVRCAGRFPGLGLALSLHSARQAQREQLSPLARRYPLDTLRGALARAAVGRQNVMIEYLLLEGINDTDEDLSALSGYLRDLPVHINLIPYNVIADAPHLRPTELSRRRAFGQALVAAGFKVTMRYSLGGDIEAACGQLVRRQETALLKH
jgi:23S rRNA (adenine2503-C2)-methyltransferase